MLIFGFLKIFTRYLSHYHALKRIEIHNNEIENALFCVWHFAFLRFKI